MVRGKPRVCIIAGASISGGSSDSGSGMRADFGFTRLKATGARQHPEGVPLRVVLRLRGSMPAYSLVAKDLVDTKVTVVRPPLVRQPSGISFRPCTNAGRREAACGSMHSRRQLARMGAAAARGILPSQQLARLGWRRLCS